MNADDRGTYKGAALRAAVGVPIAPVVIVPPYQCHCPDWYEGEDCDHDDC